MYRRLTLLLLTLAAPNAVGAVAPTAIVIDGRLTSEEWGPKLAGPVPSTGEVWQVRDVDAISLGVRAPKMGMVNLYLWRPGEVQVLHRSGSLGRARYQQQQDGSWQRTENFAWQLRGMTNKERAATAPDLAARIRAASANPTQLAPATGAGAGDASGEPSIAIADHLASFGWTAATAPLSAPHSAEFRVALAGLQGWRLIVQWIQSDGDRGLTTHTWPAGAKVAGDGNAADLLSGVAPEAVAFELEGGELL